MFVAQNAEVDAVILDMTMPGMNGYEAMLALRKFIPAMPVLKISGDVPENPYPHDGCTLFMMKPLGTEALLVCLRGLLEQRTGVQTQKSAASRHSAVH